MRKIAVAVEGPSDRIFWNRLLWKSFPNLDYSFEVISLNGRTKLIREAPALTDVFRKSGYAAVFFIVDADDARCPSQILELFEEDFRECISQSVDSRFAHLFIAFAEVESWILADEACIRELISESYSVNSPAHARFPGKAGLLKLCREKGIYLAGMQDRELAGRAAVLFSPEKAASANPSLAFVWRRITTLLDPK